MHPRGKAASGLLHEQALESRDLVTTERDDYIGERSLAFGFFLIGDLRLRLGIVVKRSQDDKIDAGSGRFAGGNAQHERPAPAAPGTKPGRSGILPAEVRHVPLSPLLKSDDCPSRGGL